MKNSEIQHYPDLKMFVMKVGDDFAKIEYTEKITVIILSIQKSLNP